MAEIISNEDRERLTTHLANFIEAFYRKELDKAAMESRALVISFRQLDSKKPELADLLKDSPDTMFEICEEAMKRIQHPGEGEEYTKIRFDDMGHVTNIRDLRSRDVGKFLCVEGIVRKASEILPKIVSTVWECPDCGEVFEQESRFGFISRPYQCNCGARRGFKQTEKRMIDFRKIEIEEPFELTEGERPSRLGVVLSDDLLTPEGRLITDPGNRLRMTGVLREVPMGKSFSDQMVFLFECNYPTPTEIGWERFEITSEDEKKIKELASDPKIYNRLVASIAPSIFGLEEIKESIVMQLFGGVTRILSDNTRQRGDIHILMIGDPASGKSQIMKLVPKLVPRGKYVSGKGTTTAGLTATVSKDEQFMGGWVLEAGAMVLANKGLLSVDEFEKMAPEDQVAMHEALEQGCYEYNTELILGNGELVKIGDFVESLTKGTGDNVIRSISNKDIHVMSTDFNKIKSSKAILVSKHAEDLLYNIKLTTGQQIKVTPKHPVFVIREGELKVIEAGKLTANDWVPVPSYIDINGKAQEFNIKSGKRDSRFKSIKLPEKSSKELCEWLGYVIGEGSAEVNRKKRNGVCFTNSDSEILQRYYYLLGKLFSMEPYKQRKGSVTMARAISRPLYDFVSEIGDKILTKSYYKALPDWVFRLPRDNIEHVLKGLFNSEGSVNCRYGTINFSTTSKKLAEQVQHLCLRLGIFSALYEDRSLEGKRKRIAYKIQITGKDNTIKFGKSVGFIGKRKKAFEELLRKKSIPSVRDHIPNIMKTVECMKKNLRLSDKECAGYILTNRRKRNHVSKPLLSRILKRFNERINEIELCLTELEKRPEYPEFRKIRERLRISRSEIAKKLKSSQQNLWYWKAVKNDSKLIKKSTDQAILIAKEMLEKSKQIKNIEFLLSSPVEWVKIKSISEVSGRQRVYDIATNPTKTFIGNGIVCHNSVSIAKASIVATLPAETSVLAGGNPKHSRFDPMRSIIDQITIPPTLLTRFDLKFILRDVPNAEVDKRIVTHMLKSRSDETYEGGKPDIDSNLIRKYIAYAKLNYKPELAEEASKMLKNFYVSSRKTAEKSSGPVPITLRQFEALIRISEASARIQLQNVIRKEDAQRAIRLMKESLRQLGFDPITGMIDIDKAEGGIGFSERNRIVKVLDIIAELSKKRKDVSISDIEKAAEKEGVAGKDETDEIIERLKRDGTLFEPSHGYVQKV